MEPNKQKVVKVLPAMIAASAIVAMAALAVGLNEEQTTNSIGPRVLAANMTLGATATTTTPPTTIPTPVAKPTMKAQVPKGFR